MAQAFFAGPFFIAKIMNPIITVKEARKILGPEASKLDDDQIREIIIALQAQARVYLKNCGSKK